MESVVQMLLSAIRDHAQHPESKADSAPLSTALVVAALKSTNPKLHSMVVLYLENVGTEHAKDLVSVLLNLAESDPSLDQFEYDIDGEASNSSEVSHPCVWHSASQQRKESVSLLNSRSSSGNGSMTCVYFQRPLLVSLPRLDGTAEAPTGTSTTLTTTLWPATALG